MKRNLLYTALDLVSVSYRRRGIVVLLLLVFSSLFDLFTLASFLPLIMLVLQPEGPGHDFVQRLFHLSSFTSFNNFCIALTVSAVLLILLKGVVNHLITLRKARYAYRVANSIASNALQQYLQTPYVNFTRLDHTRELNRIATLPLTFANNFIVSVGTLVSESLVTGGLLLALTVYEPRVMLMLAMIFTPLALVYRYMRKHIRKTSDDIKQNYPLLLKHTLQAIEALPEINAMGKEYHFRDKFTKAFKKVGSTLASDHTLHISSSRITEATAAACIGALIIYVLVAQKSSAEAMLLISIYAGVSFRVIPAINRIFAAALQIKTHEYVVEELSYAGGLAQHAPATDAALQFNEKIELKNISFRYDQQPFVFRNASLTIHKGEKVMLLGRTGSGKTTLFRILMRFLAEQSGELLLDGKPVTALHTRAFRKLIGYVPQSPYVLDASIAGNIAFGLTPEAIDMQKVLQLTRQLDLHAWISTLPEGLHTVIGEKGVKLSGGQRQRLAIARALYNDAEILLLDEVTNQLDRQTELEVMHTLGHETWRSKTIILITHRPEIWTSFNHIYELKDGCFTKAGLSEFQPSL